MSNPIHTKVLVVGGGPVGLTLAMDLAQRGIDVTVAEMRAGGELPGVRCNHVAARTMEIFRRLGLVQAVRNAGLPPDYPNDVAFRTTATGMELLAAAARRGVPMVVLDVGVEETASLYPSKLVLSRPDQHVAWRGDELPNDSIALIDCVRGASGET